MTAMSSRILPVSSKAVTIFLERWPRFFLQCADDKDTDDRDHAGLAGFPIFDHQCVDENRKRNQKHPAQTDDAAKLGNLISR